MPTTVSRNPATGAAPARAAKARPATPKKAATPKKTATPKRAAPLAARTALVLAPVDTRLDVLEALKRAGLTLESCPDDYERLRDEAVFCSRLSAYAFFVMAKRLVRIRDERLYASAGGYEHFVAFLEAELSVTPKTAFNYMALLDHFGDAAIAAHPELPYSKLLPALPLFKAAGDERTKQEIRRVFLSEAKARDRQGMRDVARDLADRLGLEDASSAGAGSTFARLAERLIEAVPKRPTRADREAAGRVLAALEEKFR